MVKENSKSWQKKTVLTKSNSFLKEKNMTKDHGISQNKLLRIHKKIFFAKLSQITGIILFTTKTVICCSS